MKEFFQEEVPVKTVYLGSTSKEKITAVESAFAGMRRKVKVIGEKTSSGQNEQPVGFDETYAGALARARAMKSKYPGHIAIGIESGIMRFGHIPKVTLDIAVIVLLTENGEQIVTTSSGIQFPEEYVVTAAEEGFDTTTVGSVIARAHGGKSTDPHATVTNGKVTRVVTLFAAMITAIRQLT